MLRIAKRSEEVKNENNEQSEQALTSHNMLLQFA
jgi:hypothetical protein